MHDSSQQKLRTMHSVLCSPQITCHWPLCATQSTCTHGSSMTNSRFSQESNKQQQQRARARSQLKSNSNNSKNCKNRNNSNNSNNSNFSSNSITPQKQQQQQQQQQPQQPRTRFFCPKQACAHGLRRNASHLQQNSAETCLRVVFSRAHMSEPCGSCSHVHACYVASWHQSKKIIKNH